MNRPAKYIIALLALAGTLWALPEAPTIDEALAMAKAQHRTVIVEFTGRDWCGACKHLHGKIFSSPEFEAAVNDRYVVTELDYPRAPGLIAQIPDEEKARRQGIMDSYGIQGLPSVVLLDEDGLPFAIIVGTRQDPASYLAELDKAQTVRAQRDAAFARAQGLSGIEKARALAEGLSVLPRTCQDKYEDVLKEIKVLDPENTLGFNNMLGAGERLAAQTKEFQDLCDTYLVGKDDVDSVRLAIDKLDEFLARTDLDPVIRQLALRAKGDCYAMFYSIDNSPECFVKTVECFREALECAPDSRYAKRLRSNIDYYENELIPTLRAQQAQQQAQPESQPAPQPESHPAAQQ